MTTTRTRRPLRWLLAALLVGLVAAVVIDALRQPTDVPMALRGNWGTDASAYATRGIEFTQDAVVFHTGPGPLDISAHAIRDLTATSAGDSTLYLLRYRIENRQVELDFTYRPGPPPTLRLTHLPQVRWVRLAPSSAR